MTIVTDQPKQGFSAATLKSSAHSALAGGQRSLRRVWHRRVIAGGTDLTLESTPRRCLVIAPHPDDETIGCGATIARKRAAGTAVDVAVVTDGRHSHCSPLITAEELGRVREQESIDACSLLGVGSEHVHLLGFEEGRLETDQRELVIDRIAELISERDPDEILVSSAHDWHPDHQAVNRLTQQAVQRSGRSIPTFAYPVWFWADGPWLAHPAGPAASRLADLATGPWHVRSLPAPMLISTTGHVDTKAAAFAEYRSQTTSLTGESSWVTFPDGWLEPFLGRYEVFFPV